jgi:Fe-S cluster biogenesis protein NfuA
MMPFSDEDLKPAVQNIIDSKIKPTLALDGGAIELIDIINGRVYVQLQGACIGCASSGNTLKYGVEKELRIQIHPEISVVNVPIGMENSLDEL